MATTPGQRTHTLTAIHITYTDRDYTDVTVSSAPGTLAAADNSWPGEALAPAIGTATITGTAHHLYWDATTRTWTEADRLRAGDLLQTDDGRTVAIVAVRSYTATAVTYNLTIDSLHTYYVEAGDTPVLVHNTGIDGCGPVFRTDTSHIFRDATGHLADDTPANRAIIEDAIAPENLFSTVKLPGNGGTLDTYRKLLPDGTQSWAEVRNGNIITNRGVNQVPFTK